MRCYTIFLGVAIFIFAAGKAQVSRDTIPISKNALSFELIGSSCSLLSIHYDRIIKVNHASYYSIDGGFGYLPPFSKNMTNQIIGASLAIDWNSGLYYKTHIMGGVGLSYSDGMFQTGLDNETKESYRSIFLNARIGLKYQKINKGMFYKIMATPIFKVYEFSHIGGRSLNIIPLLGFSAGYSF